MNKLVVMILLICLSGCGPVYKTFTTYSPPVNERGKDCVKDCYYEKNDCEKDAEIAYEICRKEAQLNAKRDYLNAKESYLNKLEDWNRQYNRCLHEKTAEQCKHHHNSKPSEPSMSTYLNYYPCDKGDDKCVENYDTCFEMCGGRIFRETRCVSNCK